jgi:hypothetical protein
MQLKNPSSTLPEQASRGPAALRVLAVDELGEAGADAAARVGVVVLDCAEVLVAGTGIPLLPNVLDEPAAFAGPEADVFGALALRAAARARAADEGRAAADAAGSGAEAVSTGAEAAGIGAATVLVPLMMTSVAVLRLAVVETVSGAAGAVGAVGVICAVTVAVGVVPADSGNAVGAVPCMNQKAAALIATAAKPIMPILLRGLEDLPGRADGGNCAGSVSSGMGFMLPVLSVLCSGVLLRAPGSVMENWVGANCVLAPYSESL